MKDDIPTCIWKSATCKFEGDSSEEPFVRMDVIWGFIRTIKTGDGCKMKFSLLSRVAKLVLILPHSNAGEESVQLGSLEQNSV